MKVKVNLLDDGIGRYLRLVRRRRQPNVNA
jgi:hypothetical protein